MDGNTDPATEIGALAHALIVKHAAMAAVTIPDFFIVECPTKNTTAPIP